MSRELSFRFPLPLGLHARPASLLRDAACAFTSAVTLVNRRSGRRADARSVLALVASATREGDECALLIAGEDEDAAGDALRRLVATELPLCDEGVTAAPPAGGERPLPRALRGDHVSVLRGTAASGGIGRAAALVVTPWQGFGEPDAGARGTPDEEMAKIAGALAAAGAELRSAGAAAANDTVRAVLRAHLAIVEDPEFSARIAAEVGSGATAARAVVTVAQRFAAALAGSGSAVLAERALDLRDVAARLVHTLAPGAAEERIALARDAVVVAESLSPAQLLALDMARLKGLVLASAGATSHTVVLARAAAVPCVTGVAGAAAIADGAEVIVDGERGLVVAGPSPEVAAFYAGEATALGAIRARLAAAAVRDAVTADGRRVEVAANVASLAEARLALAAGAEGIGLFRTELLFMDRASPPSEDEQAEVYAEVARLAAGRRVIIRTLDAGGDKPIPYLGLPRERNPFLGCRAVRMYEAHPAIVAAQIRAIARASARGRVELMFPMVSSAAEAGALRRLVAAEMAALAAAGVPFDPAMPVGVMVEVPSLAFVLDQAASAADFFSIGSNDLLQYLLAVDRDNPAVARLYDPFEPAFVRALAAVCGAARAAGRRIGLCGELGADPLATPLLVGLGLDEISVGGASVPAVKAAIARCATTECRELLARATQQTSAADVERLLRAFAARTAGRDLLAAEFVRLGSEARSKDEAIRELIGLLRAAGRVGEPDAVEDAVWQREATYSTGVGFGVAIPHGKTDAVLATSIAVATYPDGVPWGSLDGEPVTLAILVAVRASDPGETHLRTIAALSRRLMDDDVRTALLAAANADEVVARLRGAVETP